MNDKKHKKREFFDYTNDLGRNARDILACIETLERTKKSIETLKHLFKAGYRRDDPKYAIRCINYCCDSLIDVYESAVKEELEARLLHDLRFVKTIKRRFKQ